MQVEGGLKCAWENKYAAADRTLFSSDILHPIASMAATAKPAFTVDVDQTTRVITITESGQLTGKSVIDMDAKLRAMPEYAAGFHVLVDATAITRIDATGDDIYQLATRAENDRNRFAIVVRDQFAVGLARMYEIASNWRAERVGVFSERRAALDWLTA